VGGAWARGGVGGSMGWQMSQNFGQGVAIEGWHGH